MFRWAFDIHVFSASKIRIHIDARIRICPSYEFSCQSYEVYQSVSQDIQRFRYVRFILPSEFRIGVHARPRPCPKRIASNNLIFQQHIVSS